MRVLGVDLARGVATGEGAEHTLVLLEPDGAVSKVERLASLVAIATTVRQLAGGEPFVLGVNVPVVVPAGTARTRPVENRIRRRLGFKLPPGGRSVLGSEPQGIAGEALLAGLAAAGEPCLPYPDRSGRRPGLAETHPALALKLLMWEGSIVATTHDSAAREELLRAYAPPAYRASQLPSRAGWTDQASGLDQALVALGEAPGFDLHPVREALARAASRSDVESAAALFDTLLIGGTVRRYVTAPESSVFVGDHEGGYLILPADAFVRRVALGGNSETRDQLFPQTSLRERLGEHARLRAVGLLNVPGRPQRTQAEFDREPRYEFDNLDEMLWWKHCRHLAGPALPTEGLRELEVRLGNEAAPAAPLKLMRSRHRTLSFRFDPPRAWRSRIPTRDGATYAFRVVRAIYETLPTES